MKDDGGQRMSFSYNPNEDAHLIAQILAARRREHEVILQGIREDGERQVNALRRKLDIVTALRLRNADRPDELSTGGGASISQSEIDALTDAMAANIGRGIAPAALELAYDAAKARLPKVVRDRLPEDLPTEWRDAALRKAGLK